ncbi:hypothetical protein pipiens_016120 [Culex pipiens pipiens]|uniref:Uncharacterized protein n=1 Tax=Culex pipiens pipiens TaxID=38569 RepID=A0ABD1CML3_CULPP
MDEDSLICERATSAIKCCKLPRLTRSLDEGPLRPESFREFLAVLNDTLPKVFDLLASYENQLVCYDEFNADNAEFRLNLVLVLAEQLAVPGEVYDFQTENVSYRQRIEQIFAGGLLERILLEDGGYRLREQLWAHFRKVLPGTEWMFHPGDVVSFVRLCEFLYGGFQEQVQEFPQDLASFVLAIGIALVEYHDPEYELLGLRLFNVLLGSQHSTLMKETNIHEVVYQHAFRLTAKAKGERLVRELWRCHYQYVRLAEIGRKDFSEWSKMDDLVESLLDALSFEQNLELSSILLMYLLKFLTLDIKNILIDDLDDVQAVDSKCHLYEPVLEQLRKLCALEFHNRRFYRWNRRLVAMLPFELEKACGNDRIHGKYMHGVNLLFVLTVFPVEPEACATSPEVQSTLLDFVIAFKRHLREQYGRIQALTGRCDFLHSLKATISCDKSIAVFGRNVARKYFTDNLDALAGTGLDGDESYQEDRIFYECLKELQSGNVGLGGLF